MFFKLDVQAVLLNSADEEVNSNFISNDTNKEGLIRGLQGAYKDLGE